MSTEDMIKEAFQRQAERAPDHMRVLTRVMATPARRRSRAVLYTLIGARVAVAVAVPILLVRAPVSPPADSPPTGPTTPPPSAPVPGEVMSFQPGYLPDGLVESEREILPDGSLRRRWTGPAGSPDIVFERSGRDVVHVTDHPTPIELGTGVHGFYGGD